MVVERTRRHVASSHTPSLPTSQVEVSVDEGARDQGLRLGKPSACSAGDPDLTSLARSHCGATSSNSACAKSCVILGVSLANPKYAGSSSNSAGWRPSWRHIKANAFVVQSKSKSQESRRPWAIAIVAHAVLGRE